MPGCGWDWDRFAPSPEGPPGPAERWEPTFQEECTGPLDEAKWRTTYFRDNEFHHYGWSQSAVSSTNVTFADGLCNITLENRPTRGLPYTAGVLDTGGKWEQRYGYFEVRARTARGEG